MKKFISHVIGIVLGCLALLPPFNDQIKVFDIKNAQYSTWQLDIPVTVNSFGWTYAVILAGLLCTYLWFCNIRLSVKLIASYMYLMCFFSAAPYISFNAMLLVIPAFYLFILIKDKVDKEIIINWMVALFWFEVSLCVLQFFGKDKLLNFDRPQPTFLGTIMQHMRSGSLFAILAPFLILRNKLYIMPLLALAFLMKCSNLALALLGGVFVYLILSDVGLKRKLIFIGSTLIVAVGHSIYNMGSFQTAFTVGRIPVWGRIVMTGIGGMYHNAILEFPNLTLGLLRSLKGWGLNIFQCLFPVLIEDANPFAQCHNDWLQIFWELGIIGVTLILTYTVLLIIKLYAKKKILWIVGLSIIAVNMLFAFPVYMPPQTPLIILTFLALCEQNKEEKDGKERIDSNCLSVGV